ncbi:unnamed protein product [Trichogramma brassicae]|uniref:Uncharacterized protein n=1 Tax=Trichogramma brassicae TaxID=86971 RepID=A0A6H5I101_9HYME|nr:unnamed protein product [Trichogramma brassicae]
MAGNDQKCLKKLKNMRASFNWEVEGARYKILRKFYFLIIDWWGDLPNLKEIFRREEMDWFITEYLDTFNDSNRVAYNCSFVKFLIRAGYKDEPELDKDGKPVLLRTTPVHHAAENICEFIRDYPEAFEDLFKIYDRFDANYLGKYGLTHFHIACKFGRHEVVEKFLELGQDPNCRVQETGETGLHLTLRLYALLGPGREKLVESLLKHGADANLADAEGSTPLHVICNRREEDDDLAEMFFKINDEIQQTIQMDARDKLGRTPLQMAVASLMSKTVDALLDRIDDLSGFIFPSETHFGSVHKNNVFVPPYSDTNLASKALLIIEGLQKKGYEINETDALTIMKFFDYIGVVRQSLAFLFTGDYDSDDGEPGYEYCTMCHSSREAPKEPLCHAHKSTIISRGFFQHWSLGFFLKLTCHRLPILCCEKILVMLGNKDLFNVCIAVETATKEQSQTQDVLDKEGKIARTSTAASDHRENKKIYFSVVNCKRVHRMARKPYKSRGSQLGEMRSLMKNVDWDVEAERHEFLRRLDPVIEKWANYLPKLEKDLGKQKMDRLLADIVGGANGEFLHEYRRVERFIDFAIASRYKDVPDCDGQGRPVLRRPTAIHHAARNGYRNGIIDKLFRIYDRFDVNCIDERGKTHFQVACRSGCIRVVQLFLRQFGGDPRRVSLETGDELLHSLLDSGLDQMVGVLLSWNADPFVRDARGRTVLQRIAAKPFDADYLKSLFDVRHPCGFFRGWVTSSFKTLTGLLSCTAIILGQRKVKDHWNICVAVNKPVISAELMELLRKVDWNVKSQRDEFFHVLDRLVNE